MGAAPKGGNAMKQNEMKLVKRREEQNVLIRTYSIKVVSNLVKYLIMKKITLLQYGIKCTQNRFVETVDTSSGMKKMAYLNQSSELRYLHKFVYSGPSLLYESSQNNFPMDSR